MDAQQIVTNRLIEKLEEGVVPWRMPWNGTGVARRWVVDKPYRGLNAMILPPGEYASLKQIKEAGGRVKKEELKNWYMSVYWHWFKVKVGDAGVEDGSDDEANYKKMAKPYYYRVYEINKQCEGLASKVDQTEKLDFNPVEEAEKLLAAYKDKPRIQYGPGGAYYMAIFDFINMPKKEDFHSVEEFYSTIFHELVHSTGSISRLKREGVVDPTKFGSEKYAKEELVAEMGASMICVMAGLDTTDLQENSASYINGWLQKLKGDKKFIFSAASQAQAAVDYMTGVSHEEEPVPA
ncbi:hypothetical protein AF332_16790 [Sporosarcina globispora]|uniref:Antirestriction protein n=1 Tax=Sporosarcina globispora TaxID=1459 RepID=A0A0M0GET5_SPOGL|nr:zincin-like metallopeptidase domain-containing protein [Sporosarcina globispora]KON88293.1 hypothetical protein AF332_16790 [Sporosarcina globispora]